jgi:3,5-epimerase/4-reductase
MGIFTRMLKNKKMKVLVYGSTGWIGGLFIKVLEEYNIEYVRGHARIDSEFEVKHDLRKYSPTHVIAFTGRTHGYIGTEKVNTIDYLEYPGKLKENIRDNLFGPFVLAQICTEYGFHYTYIGTGCIFNGRDEYTEESLPDFFGSSYSIVKGFTDRLMKKFHVLNIRIRMPISSVPNDRNFINKIATYKKVCSVSNSMTVLDDFLPIILKQMMKKQTGTYNCTNPGVISHDEILKMYTELVDPDFTWENMDLQEQIGLLKSERSNNELSTTKIESEYNIPNIRESVYNVLKKMGRTV